MKARGERILDQIVVRWNAVACVNVNPPGHRGRKAVQFLVQIVRPARDRLCKKKARCSDIGPVAKVHLVAAGIDPQAQCAPRHSAVDGQTALPRVQHLGRVLKVIVKARYDVVEPGAHHAQDQAEQERVPHMLRVVAAALGLSLSKPRGKHCRTNNDDTIPRNGQGTYSDRNSGTVQAVISC